MVSIHKRKSHENTILKTGSIPVRSVPCRHGVRATDRGPDACATCDRITCRASTRSALKSESQTSSDQRVGSSNPSVCATSTGSERWGGHQPSLRHAVATQSPRPVACRVSRQDLSPPVHRPTFLVRTNPCDSTGGGPTKGAATSMA